MTGSRSASKLAGHGRTVLILDDDDALRTLIRRILLLHDFQVLEAANAMEAMDLLASHDGDVDLILCDLVLPGLSGREAANALMARRPDAAVLYMSGYSSHDSFRRKLKEEGAPFLGKPFEIPELLEAIQGVLDTP